MNRPTAPFMCRFPVLGLVLAVLWMPAGAAGTGGAPAATHAVALDVDAMDEELRTFGTSRARLAALMTRQLESGGVKVIAGTDLGQAGTALLRLRVRLMRSGYVELYGINLSLNNKVPIEGGTAWSTMETWSDGGTGSIAHSEVDVIEKFAAKLVQRFLAARSGRQ